ncbi:MAG: PEGA domain-containing protein [Deltaproteobacteria bacterium]|nr:PEGA domain-containing protein [Deltaproteobacteria bacterium]
MKRTRKRIVGKLAIVVLALAATSVPVASVAQATDAQAVARQRYAAGKGLFEQGKFAEALVEFQAAYDAKPHPTVLKSVAECKVQMGDVAGAVEVLQRYADDPQVTDKAAAQKRLDEVKAMLGKLQLASTPIGAGVMLDGAVTGKVTPYTFELNPGGHEVALNVEGYDPIVKQVTLETGKTAVLAVDFAADGKAVPTPSETKLVDPFAEDGNKNAEPAPEEGKASEGPSPAFWVCAAVTGVGLVSGTVFGTLALGDEDDYKKSPTQDKLDNGQRDALIADVSFGVAAAAAIVGVVILFTGDSGEAEAGAKASAKRVNVVPVATFETVGLSTTVDF